MQKYSVIMCMITVSCTLGTVCIFGDSNCRVSFGTLGQSITGTSLEIHSKLKRKPEEIMLAAPTEYKRICTDIKQLSMLKKRNW